MGDLAQRAGKSRSHVRAHHEAVSSLRDKLRLPSQLVVVGIVIAAVALAYEAGTASQIPGPIRPLWISGPLVLAGFVLGFYRLVFHDDDGE
jgi:hypothetical protein